MASKLDYAWAAGIVDGEGAISMTRARVGVNRRTTPSFQVRISVRMTHEPTIRRLHAIFGGTVTVAKARDTERHKPAFGWYAGDLLTVEALKKIRPYMTTKKKQAELVLEYRERCCPPRRLGRGMPCKASLVQMRQRYFDRLSVLNRKGPVR